MKLIVKIIAVVIILIAAFVMYLSMFLPNIPVQEDLEIEITDERIERGKYLANHVTVCIDCHSSRDWSKFSGPVKFNSEGMGGEKFDQEMGMPGSYYAPNITPYGLGDWTDGEIYRAIVSGVNKHGKALFPIMPYPGYGKMDKEDIYSIIVYLRTLPAKTSDIPVSKSDFPMSIIINTIPSEPEHSILPKDRVSMEYGAYMVNAGGCIDCHTPMEKGQIITEMKFAGGMEFNMSDGILTSPNITPDNETGIGTWTEEYFIQRFKSYDEANSNDDQHSLMQYNTVMPWTMYAGMDSTDLKSIYRYLMSLEPITNEINHFISK